MVANIDVDLILGLHFFKTHQCQIDVTRNILTVQGKSCELTCSGSIGCYRVTVSKKVQIPPMTEMLIEGKLEDRRIGPKELCIIEPKGYSDGSNQLLVARTLIYGCVTPPIRVMNITNEEQTLHPGANVATISPVCRIQNVKDVTSTNNGKVPEHLQDLFDRTTEGMDHQQQDQVAKLLIRFSNVFSKSDDDIGRTGVIKHQIPTGDAQPIKQQPRRVPVQMNEEINSQIDTMLKENVIKESSSPWASSIVMVKKKDGTSRFCVDYRKLNDVTVKDAYPLPRIDDSLDQLSGSRWFSSLDLNSGYWQVETDPKDREKTAFTSRKGLFEFVVMPFGLCNAAATFERLMETVLAGLHWQICLIYLDDVIVVGKTFEDMIQNLGLVFERLQQAGLKLKPRKCKLFAKKVTFLGHVISEAGVHTDPNKTECIENWPTPKNTREVRAFLGLCSYYRRFVYNFAEIAKPLFKLTEKNQPFKWTDDCTRVFQMLKEKLVEAPILTHPDFAKSFILDVDASDQSIGAVLSQMTENGESVIAYASRTLTKSERRYCVTRKEMLALVNFVKYYKHYLYGKKFTVRTDHGSLRWLMQFKNPEGQVARWIEFLSSFDMKIEHRPGRTHKNADGVSRIPCRQCGIVDDEDGENATYSVNILQSDQTANEVGNLRETQNENRDTRFVKELLEKGEKLKSDSVASESWYVKSLLNQWERLDIKDDILVRRWNILGTNSVRWQAVVPLSLRRKVLEYSHDIKASGHLGMNKTLSKIQQGYYWPGLQNDVRAYVGGCEKCAKKKNPTKTRIAPMQVVRSGYPMERIALDILGELPVSESGNKYILVISDYFTKWTESFPMQNMEAKTCAKILVTEVISRFGVPNKIHSDQGRQFESHLFSEMCELLQIEKTRTTPYHPQSDGMVERFNRTLCTMLGTFVEDHHRNWDNLLPYVMMAYRSTQHETTGMSPNTLMLGRETSTPLDIAFQMPPGIKSASTNDWVWELRESLETVHTFVRQSTSLSICRQKRYHDRKSNYEKIEVNDIVYVYFPVKQTGQSVKLSSFWRGPFKIKEKLADVLFIVDCGRNGSNQVIHIDRIKRAKTQLLSYETDQLPDIERTTDHDLHVDPSLPEGEEASSVNEEPYNRYGRQRRKPIWLQDYVSSLFRNMPQTKVTPRKREVSVTTICPVCKLNLKPDEDFGEHVKSCMSSAHVCSQCGTIFKKASYLRQHERRAHGGKKSDKKADIVTDLNLSESSDSDWDHDSNVQVGEPISSEDDERKIQDISSGRVIRKRTCSMPVIAPVKSNKPSATVISADVEGGPGSNGNFKEPVPHSPEMMSKSCAVKESAEQAQAECKKTEELQLKFKVNVGSLGKVKEQLELSKDGEVMINTMFVGSASRRFGGMNINLGDYLESPTLKPENISVKIENGQLSLIVRTD